MATPAPPQIRGNAPSAAAAHALVAEGARRATEVRGASRVTAAGIRARIAAEVARLHAEHDTHGATLDAHLASAHGAMRGHEQAAHGVLQTGRAAAHAHLDATHHAQATRVEQAAQQQRALAPQVVEQHGTEIDEHADAEASRFEQGSHARAQQAQQGPGSGNGETADKRGEAAAKIGERAQSNFATDASRIAQENERAAGEFRGHLHEGATNFTGSIDQMTPQFTSGIASAVTATQTGADSVATEARSAFSSMSVHGCARLETDSAAAHTVLREGTRASVAAIQSHGEKQAAQIEHDGEKVAAAILEQTHAAASGLANAPAAEGTAIAGEARSQLATHTGQATTQIQGAHTRIAGGISAHAQTSSTALARTTTQAGAHLQGSAVRIGQHLAQASAHTAAGLQGKARAAGAQIQESAGQATDHLGKAGTDFTAKAQQATAGARTSIAGNVDAAGAAQQANVATFTGKQREADGQIDSKHDQLKAEGDQRSSADQASEAANAQTFLDWILPKSWTDAIKHWFADTFGKWWGGFLWGVLNALLVVIVVIAVCLIFPAAAPFIIGGLLIAGAAVGIYSRFKMYEAYHDGKGPGFWEGLALVGLGIADITGIPSIIEGLAGQRAFSNGHKMDPFDAGESVGSGLVNLIALIVGGGRALRGKPGGVPEVPKVPEVPELPPEVKPPEVKPPEVKPPEDMPPEVRPDAPKYDPKGRTDAQLRSDTDTTPRQGETPQDAQARAQEAQEELARRGQMAACFVAGTLVHTPSGPIPIEQLALGTAVFGRPDTAICEPGEYAIADRMFGQTRTLFHVTIEGGHRVTATRNHPFYVVGAGWKQVHALALGDLLQTLDGSTVAVIAIDKQRLDAWIPTYNIHVTEASTYYVGAIGGPAVWVHNADPNDPIFQGDLLWGLGASGPRQRTAADPHPDFDGASAFETTGKPEVDRFMGIRGQTSPKSNHGAITRAQLAEKGLVAVETPSDNALSTEAGLKHYSIRPADSPDPNVKLTNEQMDFVKAQLDATKPVIQAKPKDFGCG